MCDHWCKMRLKPQTMRTQINLWCAEDSPTLKAWKAERLWSSVLAYSKRRLGLSWFQQCHQTLHYLDRISSPNTGQGQFWICMIKVYQRSCYIGLYYSKHFLKWAKFRRQQRFWGHCHIDCSLPLLWVCGNEELSHLLKIFKNHRFTTFYD